jgi:hypothetical protein
MRLRTVIQAAKFLLAAPVLIGIGVSQILYGWAGNGFVPTFIYPAVCFLMAVGCGYIGYQFLFGKPESEQS